MNLQRFTVFILWLLLALSSILAQDAPPASVEGILAAMSSDFEMEEGSVEAEATNVITNSIPAVIELSLVVYDESGLPAKIASLFPTKPLKPVVTGIVIGAHRLGPAKTVAAWNSKFPMVNAANLRRLLYTSYDIISQIDGSMDAATIIFIIIGEILKEIISEIVEQIINGILVALKLPPVINELIATIIGELVSYFVIDPMVDELISLAQDLIS